MMGTSADHQKQKLTLSKPRRLARSIVGQFIALSPSSRKRLTAVGAGVLAGIGVPVFVYAAQQDSMSQKVQTSSSSTITIQSDTSSLPEEVSSLQGRNLNQNESTQPKNSDTGAEVVINGESVPLVNGSVSREIVGNSNSQVDINVTIDHTTSSSSSSNTNIDIDSNSSSSTSDTQDPRGSPRR